MLKISSKSIEEHYECSELNILFETYLEVVDLWILNQNDPSSKEIYADFSKYELYMRSHSNSEIDTYKVEIQIFRSRIFVKLIERSLENTEVIPRSYLNKTKTEKTEFTIYLSNIKKILTDSNGFLILTDSAEQTFGFDLLRDDTKADIIRKIVRHTSLYLFKTVEVENFSKNTPINQVINNDSMKDIFTIDSVLRVTPFGDFIRMKIVMNDVFIYEICGNIIVNKISINKVFCISIVHEELRYIVIQYVDEEVVYIIDSVDQNSFISQVLGSVSEKRLDSESFIQKRAMLFTEKISIKKSLIFGSDKAPGFSEQFEKRYLSKHLAENMPEDLDELIFNCDFKNSVHISLKDMAKKWSPSLHWALSMKEGLKARNQMEDSKFKALYSTHDIAEVEKKIASAELKAKRQLENLFGNQVDLESFKEEKVVDRQWKVLASLMRKPIVYKEPSTNYSVPGDAAHEFISLLAVAVETLLVENAPSLNFSSGKFLKFFVGAPISENLKKVEALNKNMLLNDTKGLHFFKTISEFMIRFLVANKAEREDLVTHNIFSLEGILSIFESILFKRKDSTQDKDLQRTLTLLKSPLYFQCLAQLSLVNRTELVFHSSLCMNSIIECLSDRERVKEYQKFLLNHSTLLLRHLELCLSPVSMRQKQSSILLIYHCLIENPLACSLLTRLVPKPLISTVEEEAKDISKWSLGQWESLMKNLNLDYNSATQQWSQDSRGELLRILKSETEVFYSKLRPLTSEEAQAIIAESFATPEFVISQTNSENFIQLRWNFEEYEARQDVLARKLPVYKYYIEEILRDDKDPRLTVQNIINPRKFWDELTTAFISTEDIEEQAKYLKVLILLYRKYSRVIKEVTFMRLILNLIPRGPPMLSYLALQFILVALNVEDTVSQVYNMKKFLDSRGLSIILEHIQGCLFTEDLNTIDYKRLEAELIAGHVPHHTTDDTELGVSGRTPRKVTVGVGEGEGEKEAEVSSEKAIEISESFKPIFLFYNCGVPREALTPGLQKCNEVIFCVKIFHACILRTKSQATEALLLTPRPAARQVSYEASTIELFQQCMFLKDDFQSSILNEFLIDTYMDKFHFDLFTKNLWVFPLLLNQFSSVTCSSVARLLREMFLNLMHGSTGQTQTFFRDIHRMNIASPVCSLSLYSTETDPDPAVLDFVRVFPGILYLPAYFWHVLVSKSPEEFTRLLLNESVETPLVSWNTSSLEIFRLALNKRISSLAQFDFSAPFDFSFVTYPFCRERVVGGVLLRAWLESREPSTIIDVRDVTEFGKLVYSAYFETAKQVLEYKATSDSHVDLPLFCDLELASQALVILMRAFKVQHDDLLDYVSRIIRYADRFTLDQLTPTFLFSSKLMVVRTFLSALKVLLTSLQTDKLNKIHMAIFSSQEFKSLLLEIFSKPLEAYLQGQSDLTYFKLKAARLFLRVYSLLCETTGFEFVSLRSEDQKSPYDSEHILSNLYVSAFSEMIGFLTGWELSRSGSGEKQIQDQDIIKAANFRRKQNPDDRTTKPGSSQTQPTPAAPPTASPKEPESEEEIPGLSGSALRGAILRGDWSKIKTFFGDLDPLYKNLLLVFHARDSRGPATRAVRRKCIRFLEDWMTLVKRLSKNPQNADKLISSGLAWKCLILSFQFPRVRGISRLPDDMGTIRTNLHRFFYMSLSVFQNVLVSGARSVLKISADSADAGRLSSDWRRDPAEPTSPTSTSDLQASFFHAAKKLLGFPLMVMILNNLDTEELLAKLPDGLRKHDLFLNEALLGEIAVLVRAQLLENLKTGQFGKFDLIFKSELVELKDQTVVGGIYIVCYLEAPGKLERPQPVAAAVGEALKVGQKESTVSGLMSFLSEVNLHNSSELSFDSDFFDMIFGVAEKVPAAREAALNFAATRAAFSESEAAGLAKSRGFASLIITACLEDPPRRRIDTAALRAVEAVTGQGQDAGLDEAVAMRALTAASEEDRLAAAALFVGATGNGARKWVTRAEAATGGRLLPSHAASLLNDKDLIHPLLLINKTTRAAWRLGLNGWLRAALAALRSGGQRPAPFDFLAAGTGAIRVKPPLRVDDIDVILLLHCEDNRFLLGEEGKRLAPALAEALRTSAAAGGTRDDSMLLASALLVASEAQPCVALPALKNTGFFGADSPQILRFLAAQLGVRLPAADLRTQIDLLRFLSSGLEAAASDASPSFDNSMILLLLVSVFHKFRGEFPLQAIVEESQFVSCALRLRSSISSLTQPSLLLNLIDQLLAICILHDCVGVQSLSLIKEACISSYFDIIGRDPSEVLEHGYIGINEKIPSRHTFEYWDQTHKDDLENMKLPIFYRPQLEIEELN